MHSLALATLRKGLLRPLRLTVISVILLCAAQTAQAQFSWSGTQTLAGGDNITQNITLTGNVTINVPSGTATISGVISGVFDLTKTGAGTLVFTANNTYSGITEIRAGDLQFGNGGTTGQA
ncbi:MAG: autotransporter-associated beta strand repeat-containing protein, partial [Bacteroidales bacterium]|nr:autotransporter-associated beta strand repeat-containing protein [Bacteroidales bacterium]